MENNVYFKEYLTESITNKKVDFLHRAYGEKYNTYEKFFDGVSPELLKRTDRFFIDKSDKKMPIKLLTKHAGDIIGMGVHGGELMPLLSRATLPIADFAN